MNTDRHKYNDECLVMSYELRNNSTFITHNSELGVAA